MTEPKKEIKISKSALKKNISLIIISLFSSFTILFCISLFGEIEISNVFENPRNLVYKGILADKEFGYHGSGNLDEHLVNYNPNNTFASSIVQDNSSFTIERNFIIEFESFDKIRFKHKLLVFYLPLIMFEKFWLWMLLSLILFSILKFKNKFDKKYSIKFE